MPDASPFGGLEWAIMQRMRPFHLALIGSAPLAGSVVLFFGACGGSQFITAPAGDDVDADAMVESGAPDGSTGIDGSLSDAGSGDADSGKIVYVSTNSGNDSNSGLSPSLAKKTIASALLVAAGVPSTEVHVCQGAYPESALGLNEDVSLLGGYDCSTWRRRLTYGFPTFDAVNQTTIQNGDVSAQSATLLVGTKLSLATVIDGFTIQGGTSTTGPVGAVLIQGGGAPTISNNVIEGGTGQRGDDGLRVRTASTSRGDRGADDHGQLDQRWGRLRGRGQHRRRRQHARRGDHRGRHRRGRPRGGVKGPGAVGAIAVEVAATLTTPISDCVIAGADTAAGPSYAYESAGVAIGTSASANVAATIESSQIEGGNGAGPSVSIGVAIETLGDVNLVGDRIYGGKRTSAASATGVWTVGVDAVAVGTLLIVDSMIHAGTVSAGAAAYGVEIISATHPPQVLFDTIYRGNAIGASAGIYFAGSAAGALIKDDLILGSGNGGSALNFASCSNSGTLGSLDHVIFANPPLLTCYSVPSSLPDSTIVQIPQSRIGNAVALVSRERRSRSEAGLRLAPTRGASLTLRARARRRAFPPSLPRESSDDGVTSLFASEPATADGGIGTSGWVLSPKTPCKLAASGAPIAGITVDANGSPRSAATPTVGAQEFTGPCADERTPCACIAR